jgi:hypothetical protein
LIALINETALGNNPEMLDTLKVKIPLNERQYSKVAQQIIDKAVPQWVLYHPKTGEMDFLRVKGLAETDQNSYHRQIRFDLPSSFVEGQTGLVCEFSLPKLHYGHNVSLLYDWLGVLYKFKARLEAQFKLTSNRWQLRLPCPETWELLRVDLCYAFQFPNQPSCHKFLESLKRFSYPRKKPIQYDTAILFTGATYSLKVYEKRPEFKAHDAKELAKARANPDWINYLTQKSEGILRVEATLRRKYLKVNGLTDVNGLLKPHVRFSLPEDWPEGKIGDYALHWLIEKHLDELGTDHIQFTESMELVEPESGIAYLDLEDHNDLEPIDISDPDCYNDHYQYHLAGRRVQVQVSNRAETIIQFFIDKLLGGCPGMQTIDQIRIALSEHYKPAKVGRLASFWLYVQRFGAKDAKEQFGHNSYYVARRDLKKCGVSLLSYAENVIPMDKDFAAAFKMKCPSEYVSNRYDDFSDGDNLLNLPVAGGQ